METQTQVSLFQIDDYGPWTVTPEPRYEMDLQVLQSRLFRDIARFVGSKGGYVFQTRYDNVIGITNHLDMEDHALLQESIANNFPVTVSIGVSSAPRPGEAVKQSTQILQERGSAQDPNRVEVLGGTTTSDEPAVPLVAHFDIVDVTGEYTDEISEYETFQKVMSSYLSLSEYMRSSYGALSFYAGGDNVIAICPYLKREDFEAAVEHVMEDGGPKYRVGIGHGQTIQDAGMSAKDALETCRERQESVHLELQTQVL
ncbi:GTP cyclohydrolase IIa [Natrinema halophilum]|uniref:GTP cyclohydrolase III n=1 Tax=Natrinema halophilum TaxID=1699371 RepID=A0A7D5GM94_9EURY|nr:GTP cyclohydrolase IIa [Natrinema halophilum]QLG49952.1 GTP cyclohydrolase IIa [Natrinema halophilum]